ncbi:FAD-dependent monooxygenase [Micromonospora carbonacea]|uniref:FAD-dependent monooxygenase n=1 Tax=Micromonospora carbonacea TaxID=47853 RepID=A0A7H8XKY4_9ACTN|nr:FAD-dependent monooxygenase [Micromonospora carbonacea]MBB5825922.1 2-polyprenyl-6-methoxyphenol hydroxylase-like FAD-dependent oxidoreductase [Micromonospora carbonacea]QLD25515.1 FAD-dependent monooxygenase [Micromonospora carbonacea]
MSGSATGSVVVVGAGVGGLAAAIGMAGLGHRVTVLERRVAQERLSGACLGVQSNAAMALRMLGVAKPVLTAGVPVGEYRLVSWRGRYLASWSLAEATAQLGAPSVTVPRAVLMAALRSGVPDEAVRTGAPVAAVDEDATGVTAHLVDGTTVRGDLLIGADGLHSTVRAHVVGDRAPTSYAGYDSWRGTAPVSVETVSEGTALHVVGAGRSFGAWPLPDGRTYWVATLADPPRTVDLVGEFVTAPPFVGRLLKATDPDAVLRTPIHDRDPVDTWHTGRVALLGDAVHPMQPTTGQGGSQALLDVLALTAELRGVDLADAGALRRSLAAYQTRRGPATEGMVREAREIGRMHHLSSPVATRVRDLVLRATPRRVWQRRTTARLDELELLSAWQRPSPDRGEPTWNDTH